jgi:hypothetical protein
MSWLRELRRRWSEVSLGYDLEHGRRLRGRAMPDRLRPPEGGAQRVAVRMGGHVRIEATKIYADGRREYLGVIADSDHDRAFVQRRQQAEGRRDRRIG